MDGKESRFLAQARNTHRIECWDRHGKLRWVEKIPHNLITTAGLNKLLDACFKTGLASPAWYVGIVDGTTAPTFDVGDTMAVHAGWTEWQGYLETARPSYVPGDIADGAVDNSGSRVAFTMTAEGTISGCFIVDDPNLVPGTAGTVYGEGAFSGGDRPVEIGDVLRLTSTLSVAD